jgi:hypothetical protein
LIVKQERRPRPQRRFRRSVERGIYTEVLLMQADSPAIEMFRHSPRETDDRK